MEKRTGVPFTKFSSAGAIVFLRYQSTGRKNQFGIGEDMEGELNAKLHLLALAKDELESFYPSPVPVLTRFEAGWCLYKWTGYGLVNSKTGKITQYWLPWTGFKIGSRDVPGFKELRTRYRNVDGSVGRPQEFARARNAVTEQWNPMHSILKASFSNPYGDLSD